jgi:hypothetical protein
LGKLIAKDHVAPRESPEKSKIKKDGDNGADDGGEDLFA